MHVQRWRLILARSSEAPDLGPRELLLAWDSALVAAGLRNPAAPDGAKFVPGAPMSAGLTADAELADLFLAQRHTMADLRSRLVPYVPAGYRLVDLHDVWTGEAALPGRIVAGDYLVEIEVAQESADERGPDGLADRPAPKPALDVLRSAAHAVLAATHVERLRSRPGSQAGNLRPLIVAIRLMDDGKVWMRMRFDPKLGTGRPEEVVAAMASVAGAPWVVGRRHRERLWLRDEEP